MTDDRRALRAHAFVSVNVIDPLLAFIASRGEREFMAGEIAAALSGLLLEARRELLAEAAAVYRQLAGDPKHQHFVPPLEREQWATLLGAVEAWSNQRVVGALDPHMEQARAQMRTALEQGIAEAVAKARAEWEAGHGMDASGAAASGENAAQPDGA